jgi:hypothetical protein
MDLRRPLAVVTPTLDGDVLAVLAGAEGPFSGRQVHVILGRGSETGVRRALERLRRQGIVSARHAGAAWMYQLNRSHLAAPFVEGLANLPRLLVDQLRTELASWERAPFYVAIFGSFARGEAGPDSDIDLFIVRPAGIDEDDAAWRGQIDRALAAARSWTGNDARVLEYGEDELRSGRDRDPLLQEINESRIELVGTFPRPSRGGGS